MKSLVEKLNEAMKKAPVNKNDREAIKQALENGFWLNSKANDPENGDDKKYLVTVENAIRDIFDPAISGVDEVELQKILKEITPKYQTNKDGEADAKKNKWVIA